MRSIKEIFVIGHGPSSSHTMGPAFACDYILEKYKDDIKSIKVTLYGSLALTGKGHLTDYIIKETFKNINNDVIDALNIFCAGVFFKGQKNYYYTDENWWIEFIKKNSGKDLFEGNILYIKSKKNEF